MQYDAVIIGAGMSGLAAGIRLAYYNKRVCIVERHHTCGGLNSYYTFKSRLFDVGLHAITNYLPPGAGGRGPLKRILRQLRLSHEELDLRPQHGSEIRFPGRQLRFTNDIDVLIQEVADRFPGQVDGFRRLVTDVKSREYALSDTDRVSARSVLRTYMSDDTLIEMLLCPIMYYGSAQEHEIDFGPFAVLFRSIFCEGFARPAGGVRTILKALVTKFRDLGGKLVLNCGAERLEIERERVVGVVLETGENLTADMVISSAGFHETMGICSDSADRPSSLETGQLSFSESVSILDVKPSELGIDTTIVFFNDSDTFTYARPTSLVDLRSGVLCCPNNFEGSGHPDDGMLRLTTLANHKRWSELSEQAYRRSKLEWADKAAERAIRFVPDFRDRVIARDVFTPRTIQKFTGHLNGAVYGAPHKIYDGRTRVENLFICGTDQGFLGIIGAMLSGVMAANDHGLLQE